MNPDEIKFDAYVDYARMGRDGEVVITLRSSDPEAFALLAKTLEESVECPHDDPVIWFSFTAVRP